MTTASHQKYQADVGDGGGLCSMLGITGKVSFSLPMIVGNSGKTCMEECGYEL